MRRLLLYDEDSKWKMWEVWRRKMKERPILFIGEMVRAILDGRKTMTRRICKHQPFGWAKKVFPGPYKLGEGMLYGYEGEWIQIGSNDHRVCGFHDCPYGQPGDRLWVRETWTGDKPFAQYKATNHGVVAKWKPSIHMPRWASRITLEITNVRVERLQDISEEDAKAEAVVCPYPPEVYCEKGYPEHFKELWESIDGPERWKKNPWVWVIEFKVVKK